MGTIIRKYKITEDTTEQKKVGLCKSNHHEAWTSTLNDETITDDTLLGDFGTTDISITEDVLPAVTLPYGAIPADDTYLISGATYATGYTSESGVSVTMVDGILNTYYPTETLLKVTDQEIPILYNAGTDEEKTIYCFLEEADSDTHQYELYYKVKTKITMPTGISEDEINVPSVETVFKLKERDSYKSCYVDEGYYKIYLSEIASSSKEIPEFYEEDDFDNSSFTLKEATYTPTLTYADNTDSYIRPVINECTVFDTATGTDLGTIDWLPTTTADGISARFKIGDVTLTLECNGVTWGNYGAQQRTVYYRDSTTVIVTDTVITSTDLLYVTQVDSAYRVFYFITTLGAPYACDNGRILEFSSTITHFFQRYLNVTFVKDDTITALEERTSNDLTFSCSGPTTIWEDNTTPCKVTVDSSDLKTVSLTGYKSIPGDFMVNEPTGNDVTVTLTLDNFSIVGKTINFYNLNTDAYDTYTAITSDTDGMDMTADMTTCNEITIYPGKKVPSLSRAGYTFEGWSPVVATSHAPTDTISYFSADGTNERCFYYNAVFEDESISAVYAVWSAATTSYTVNHNYPISPYTGYSYTESATTGDYISGIPSGCEQQSVTDTKTSLFSSVSVPVSLYTWVAIPSETDCSESELNSVYMSNIASLYQTQSTQYIKDGNYYFRTHSWSSHTGEAVSNSSWVYFFPNTTDENATKMFILTYSDNAGMSGHFAMLSVDDASDYAFRTSSSYSSRKTIYEFYTNNKYMDGVARVTASYWNRYMTSSSISSNQFGYVTNSATFTYVSDTDLGYYLYDYTMSGTSYTGVIGRYFDGIYLQTYMNYVNNTLSLTMHTTYATTEYDYSSISVDNAPEDSATNIWGVAYSSGTTSVSDDMPSFSYGFSYSGTTYYYNSVYSYYKYKDTLYTLSTLSRCNDINNGIFMGDPAYNIWSAGYISETVHRSDFDSAAATNGTASTPYANIRNSWSFTLG